MKMKRVLMVLGALALTSSLAWAAPASGKVPTVAKSKTANSGSSGKMPEMDAASGTMAIALLSGVILLMRERGGSRRS